MLGHALAGELRGDVDAAVADPDDEHALADEVGRLGRGEVVVGVDALAVECARELCEARVPVVPVADDKEVELLALAAVDVDPPPAIGEPLGALDRRLEPDAVPQPERLRVAVDVGEDLLVMGVVRVFVRPHRHVAERDAVAPRVDVKRAVGRRAPIRVAEVPVAPDVVRGLEAGVGDAAVGQRLAGAKAADPGPDHAGFRFVGHSLLGLSLCPPAVGARRARSCRRNRGRGLRGSAGCHR